MKELSLHILDIVQNSIAAGANFISIVIYENTAEDVFEFTISDNGKGMSKEFLKKVEDPFTTGRTTRRVGLGIPLLKLAAERAEGGINITSEINKGTVINANFVHSHVDRQPLGNMAETILGLITANDEIDFVYKHSLNENIFELETKEIKQILGDISLSNPEVVLWLSEYLKEGELALKNK